MIKANLSLNIKTNYGPGIHRQMIKKMHTTLF